MAGPRSKQIESVMRTVDGALGRSVGSAARHGEATEGSAQRHRGIAMDERVQAMIEGASDYGAELLGLGATTQRHSDGRAGSSNDRGCERLWGRVAGDGQPARGLQ